MPWWFFNPLRVLLEIIANQEKIMATLTDIKDAVAAERTVVDSVVTLLADLSQRLKDAIASNDPAALQAIADDINREKEDLAAAIVANTPAATTP